MNSELITFQEARIKFIEQLKNEETKISNSLKEKFKTYSNPKLKQSNLRLILAFDRISKDSIEYQQQRWDRLNFTIRSLNKLNTIVINESKRIKNTDGSFSNKKKWKTIKFVHNDNYKSIICPLVYKKKEINQINNKIQ